jgi:hypothetical protein
MLKWSIRGLAGVHGCQCWGLPQHRCRKPQAPGCIYYSILSDPTAAADSDSESAHPSLGSVHTSTLRQVSGPTTT